MTVQIALNSRLCCSRIATSGKIERNQMEAKLCLILAIRAAVEVCEATEMRPPHTNRIAEQMVSIAGPGPAFT
jgi:hypothetical protein